MTVTVNGLDREVRPGSTVDEIVAALTGDPRGVAVAVNGEVVPRAGWASATVHDGDRIEVLTAVQGG